MRIALALGTALLAGPAGASAQFPGGALTSSDIHSVQFRQSMLGEVTSFMKSWEQSWWSATTLPSHGHYTRDAALLQPDGAFVLGRDAVRTFARDFGAVTAEARTALLDFDASEGIGYFYGPFGFMPRHGEAGEIMGRQVAIVVRDGRDWRIRAQFFATTDTGYVHAAGTMYPAPFEFASANPDAQAAYGFVTLLMQSLRQQWSTGDAGGARSIASDDILVQLPGDLTPLRGRDALAALESRRGTLHTGVADFHQRGRMSYLMGPYYLQQAAAPDRAGRYMAVFMSYDGIWLLRSLVFT